MALRDDVNAGLAAITSPVRTLDGGGACLLTLPVPPAIVQLTDDELPVNVAISSTGRFLTLSSPLAVIEGELSHAVAFALLNRQFHADQGQGVGFAIGAEEDVLVAVYHWVLPAITPQEFRELFEHFTSTTLELVQIVGELASIRPEVRPVHPGASG